MAATTGPTNSHHCHTAITAETKKCHMSVTDAQLTPKVATLGALADPLTSTPTWSRDLLGKLLHGLQCTQIQNITLQFHSGNLIW